MAAKDDGKPDQGGGDSRLETLEKRLNSAASAEAERTGANDQGVDANYRLGNRVLAELLGGLFGGALLGWLFDRVAGTAPWGLLAVTALGVIVAFRNIIRISNAPPK